MTVMNRMRYFVMLLTCLILFVSCSNSDDDVSVKNGVAGNWYCIEDETIYAVEFRKDGTGAVTSHTYSSIPTAEGYKNGWVSENIPFQYTLVENLLTVRLSGGEVLVAVVGITGNSLSLVSGDSAVMLALYDGSEREIDELKKKYEDELMDNIKIPVPADTIREEYFWKNENNVQSAISAIYRDLLNYEYKQLQLEKIRLTRTGFDDCPAPAITPYDGNVADTWNAAYKVINETNMAINALETVGGDLHNCIAYLNEAKALRCMVYYNLSKLWGRVPYITISRASDNYDEILCSPVLWPQEMCAQLDATLQEIGYLPECGGHITMETVKALRAEIALSSGNKEEAQYLLGNCSSDFSITVDEQTDSEIYRIFGGRLPNYTSEKTALLLKEAGMEAPADKSSLSAEWKEQKQYWGYWTMLKRTGQALTVAGCEAYELLMPLPQSEIERFPALLQNPGY